MKAALGLECRFVDVGLFDANVIITLANVEFGVESRSAQFVDEIANEWQRVLVTDRIAVDGAIVLHRSELAIFLFDEEE